MARVSRTFSPIYRVEFFIRAFRELAICSPDGRAVALSLLGGPVSQHETVTGLRRRELAGHRDGILAIGFTADGRRLVTGSADTTVLVWDTSLASLARPAKLDPGRAWADLGSLKAEEANGALAFLGRDPARAVAVVREHVRPAVAVSAETIHRLLDELGSERFAVRGKAYWAPDRLGEAAVPALRRRAEKPRTEEVRRRIGRLLDKYDGDMPAPSRLREIRAVEVLEQAGTPEARELLRMLAGGLAEARLTQDARAALGRLARRGVEANAAGVLP